METMPKATYNRFGRNHEYLKVSCWCGCQTVTVPADDVRRGITGSCGRRLCTAIGYSQVLTAGGEPCDCGER
jgi:hypothetical protein